jgi:hypothetical protein
MCGKDARRVVVSYFAITLEPKISAENSFVKIRSHNISSYFFSRLKIKKVIHII